MSFNLATILTETALAAPDGPVYRFAGTATTHRQLDEQSGRFAAGLREVGHRLPVLAKRKRRIGAVRRTLGTCVI